MVAMLLEMHGSWIACNTVYGWGRAFAVCRWQVVALDGAVKMFFAFYDILAIKFACFNIFV